MDTYTFDPRLAELLTAWYRQHARDLPWRRTRDPYAIWLSEIMLQQTQVETVIPYYTRFLAALPTLAALAQAPESQVLKLWEGLGYYSRARNLHRGAQAVAAHHGGRLPDDYAALRALPGIGDYTAGAILSIAFDRPCPAVDGNVLRVAARLLEITEDTHRPAVRRAISQGLGAIYPATGCGDLTQSLMELGATVCLPGDNPRCGLCPVFALCRAGPSGRAAWLPVKSPKKPKAEQTLTVFVLTHAGRLALVRRPDSGLLAGMWALPNLPQALSAAQAEAALADWGLRAISAQDPSVRSHVFTHVRWRMLCYRFSVACAGGPFDWADARQRQRHYPLPAAFKKCLSGWDDTEEATP